MAQQDGQAIVPADGAPAAEARASLAQRLDLGRAGLLDIVAAICVEAPVEGLTVRHLFRLGKGSIVGTSQLSGGNVPLRVGGQLLAWGEFQVAGERLAVRVAELA